MKSCQGVVLHVITVIYTRLGHVSQQVLQDILYSWSIHMDATVWNEDVNKKVVLLP